MGTRLADLINPGAEAALRQLAGVPAPDVAIDAATGMIEIKADTAGPLEHKADPGLGGAQVLSTDDDTGRVVALVSVTGVEDRVKDTIEPGAYTKTLATHEPIGVWSHDDKTWVARTEHAVELMPGDPFFDGMKTMDGKPWPKEAGAVKVESLFNLDTPHGAAAYSDVKFFKGKTGWSIGYRATRATRNPRTGSRSIKELDWFEYSPVMVGAASQPMTLSVKSLAAGVDPNDTAGLIDDAVLATLSADELTRYDELKASLGLEVKTRHVRTPAGAAQYGSPIGSPIVARDLKPNHVVSFQGMGPGGPSDPVAVHGEVTAVKPNPDVADGVIVTVDGKEHKLPGKSKIDVVGDAPVGNDDPERGKQFDAMAASLPDADLDDAIKAQEALPDGGFAGGAMLAALRRAKATRGSKDADLDLEEKVGGRVIRTAEGARRYKQPIGSVVVPDTNGTNTAEHPGGGVVSDADLAVLIRAAAKDGDKEHLDLLRQAAKLNPKQRRHALTHAADGKLAKPGDDGKAGPGTDPASTPPAAKPAAADAVPSADDLRSVAADDVVALWKRLSTSADTAEFKRVDAEIRRRGLDRRVDSKSLHDAVMDTAHLAAVNVRRRGHGLAPLDALDEETKGLGMDVVDALADIESKGSSASLNRSPRTNWVEKAGDLPPYVREVARSIEKTGKTLDAAIPIAISRIKKWALGGDGVTAETQAKAKVAVGQWEALKAKAHLKFDSDLLEHIEWKASAAIDQVEDAWALLYELGEVGDLLGRKGLYAASEVEPAVVVEPAAAVAEPAAAVVEVKALDSSDFSELLARANALRTALD